MWSGVRPSDGCKKYRCFFLVIRTIQHVRPSFSERTTSTPHEQCCGSRMFIPDPGSDFFPSRIPDPDPNFSIPDPGSASKNLSILTQKMVSKL